MKLKEYFQLVYSKSLGTGSPINSNIWFIGNEESGVWSIEEVEDKLYFDGLLDFDHEFYPDKSNVYLYDPSFDKRRGFSDEPDEFKSIEDSSYYFFTKQYNNKFRVNDNMIGLNAETGCIYDYYFNVCKGIIKDNKFSNRFDFLNNYFISDFYFLPCGKDNKFEEIYGSRKYDYYKSKYYDIKDNNEMGLLKNRIFHLKAILDERDYYLDNKIITFWGNDKLKIKILTDVFGSFEILKNDSGYEIKLNTIYKNIASTKKVENIFFTQFGDNIIFIFPFISKISELDIVSDVLKEYYNKIN